MKYFAESELIINPDGSIFHLHVKPEQLADKIILVGDPGRVALVASHFETKECEVESREFKTITGTYKGKRVSVMGSGMGMASMGIYSYELFKFYDVDCIIRIGSCGGYIQDLNLKDIIVVNEGYSESTFAEVYDGNKEHSIAAKNSCNDVILETAKEMNLNVVQGNVHSTDAFY